MHAPAPGPPTAPALTEMRDGAPPPQPEEPTVPEAPGPAPSRLARLRDVLADLLWF